MRPSSRYQIVNGDVKRRVYGARKNVMRDSRALAVIATEGDTAKDGPLTWWATDLRRGRRSIYGSLLRVIDLLYIKGFAMETALMIPRVLDRYIRELWSGKPADAAPVEQKEAA